MQADSDDDKKAQEQSLQRKTDDTVRKWPVSAIQNSSQPYPSEQKRVNKHWIESFKTHHVQL